jgi:hypothetical protein
MSDIIGVRNNNTIVPYTAATKRTKQISLTTGDIAAGTNFSSPANIVGNIICYADSSGNWKARVNVRLEGVVANNAASCLIGFPNLTFKARSTNFYQAVSVTIDSATYSGKDKRCYTSQGGSTIVVDWTDTIAGPNTVAFYVSFDVELNAEPTAYTTAANMEGVLPVDVYIAPATATSTGLVDTAAQSFAGPKTFTNGISLGNETLSVYDEGTFSATFDTGAMTGASSATVTVKYIKTGNTVILFFPDTRKTTTATNSTWSTSAATLPVSLTPAVDMYQPFTTLDNGGVPTSFSSLSIQTDRKISVARTANWSSGTANCGFLNCCVTYLLT